MAERAASEAAWCGGGTALRGVAASAAERRAVGPPETASRTGDDCGRVPSVSADGRLGRGGSLSPEGRPACSAALVPGWRAGSWMDGRSSPVAFGAATSARGGTVSRLAIAVPVATALPDAEAACEADGVVPVVRSASDVERPWSSPARSGGAGASGSSGECSSTGDVPASPAAVPSGEDVSGASAERLDSGTGRPHSPSPSASFTRGGSAEDDGERLSG